MRPQSRIANLRGGSTYRPLMPRYLFQPADEKVVWLRPWIAEDCDPGLMAASIVGSQFSTGSAC
eukprot:15313063-Alexandrium_andersonii.AAC.1